MKMRKLGALALAVFAGGWASVAGAVDLTTIALPNDRNRADMVAEYENYTKAGGADFHLAVAPNGGWAVQWRSPTGKFTREDVRRNALQKCEQFAGEPCGLVVEADAAMGAYTPEPSGLVYGGRFNADNVPFVRAGVRQELASKYANADSPRALAIHRNGFFAYRFGDSQARRNALAKCEEFSKSKDCFIYDVNGTVEFTKNTPLRNPG